MPLDPTLDELSSEQQRQMTHQPEPPNPAVPYVDAGRRFAKGVQTFSQSGLTGVFPSLRRYMPGFANTLGDLVQSPAARDVFSTANFGGIPFGGIIKLARGKEIFGMQNFKVNDQFGKWIGDAQMKYNPQTKGVYVGWLGTDDGPMSVGTDEIRTLIPAIEEHYPDVRQIGAIRMTGAREKAGKENRVINIYKHNDGQWRFRPPQATPQSVAPPPYVRPTNAAPPYPIEE